MDFSYSIVQDAFQEESKKYLTTWCMQIKGDIFNVLIPQNSCFFNISDDRDILTGQAAHLQHKSLDLQSMMTQRGRGKKEISGSRGSTTGPALCGKTLLKGFHVEWRPQGYLARPCCAFPCVAFHASFGCSSPWSHLMHVIFSNTAQSTAWTRDFSQLEEEFFLTM